MRGQKRPQTERARAVGLAVVVGQEEAGRQLGIPKTTIHALMNRPEFAQLRTTARETVGDLFWVSIQQGLEQVHAGMMSDAEPLRSKADALAMLIEKRALLMGDATSRSEVTHFRDYNDEERRRLSEAIDRLFADELPQDASAEVREPAAG
jgi:hypothetical protein